MNNKPKILFRVEANSKLGTGHLMRCLALAQALMAQGAEVSFASAGIGFALQDRIRKIGASPLQLELEEVGSPSDAQTTVSLANTIGANWIVVDGYDFTDEYQKALKTNTSTRLLFIDDVGHCDYYHADIILNHNFSATAAHYKNKTAGMVLAGQEYCLIRQEFTQNQVPKRVYPEVAQKILITMGGADPGNDSGKIIGVLELLASQNSGWQPVIAVTAGGANPHVTLLQKQISESNLNIELHINTAEMFELMTWCDLAISSGGGTVWELCYTGTPAAIGMIADPEKGMLDIVATTKHAQSLGDLRGATTKTIAELLNPVIKSVELRKSYSEKSKKMIDGLGATRVAKTLLEKV